MPRKGCAANAYSIMYHNTHQEHLFDRMKPQSLSYEPLLRFAITPPDMKRCVNLSSG